MAAAILLLQFQPLVGLALCELMSGSDRGRMETDCPMPEGRGGTEDSGLPAITGLGSDQGCILTEACGPRPPAVWTTSETFEPALTDFDPPSLPADAVIPSLSTSPPVPPPRLIA